MDRLEALARRLVDEANDSITAYMKLLRWDPKRVEDMASLFDPEYDHLEQWYALVMAKHLKTAPSLSSYGTLMFVLRDAGWMDTSVYLLVGGESLSSLIEACRIRWFITTFRRAAYGGWLPLSQAERLIDRLTAVEDSFRDPSKSVLDWYELNRPNWNDDQVRKTIFDQYREAMDMLQAGISRGHPLRLGVDE